MEGMEQRKQMMAMWAGAVENLRQRDTDIRHIREVGTVCERIQCHSLEDFNFFYITNPQHRAFQRRALGA